MIQNLSNFQIPGQVPNPLYGTLNRNLIFVHGKGGVGKTVVSQAVALRLAEKGSRTLWVTVEDPTQPQGGLIQLSPTLWHLNCDFTQAFEEYSALKIGATSLTRLFLQNKVIRYLAKAAPGVHELVLLGKIWFERTHYSHVVVDLPSTGYGLAMFQSTENFSRLFRSGPLYRDAEEMLKTFHDPSVTGHLIVALPEEMPLRESLELADYLKSLFPENPPAYLVNRLFPGPSAEAGQGAATLSNSPPPPHSWASPLAQSSQDYVMKRFELEEYNLRLWRDEKIDFGKIDYVIPTPVDTPPEKSVKNTIRAIADQLQRKSYL